MTKKYNKNILLTGGAGYIGSTVAHDLIKSGHKVTIVDNLSTGYKNLIPSKARFYKADISNIQILKKIIKSNNFDLVMHFAAFVKVDESVKKPKKYFSNNYNKTKSFLNCCFEQGLNKIIFSSTASVYGNRKKKVKEKNKLLPDNPYALSKMKCERFILDADHDKKCKFVILRYFNVAGSPKNLKTGLIAKKQLT